MKILSIETSCDETAISLIEANGEKAAPKFEVLGNVLYSQASKHEEFGGVYPSLAKREHAKNLIPLLKKLFKETEQEQKIDEQNQNPADEYVDKNADEIKEILSRESDLATETLEYLSTIKKPEIVLIAVTSGPGLEPALWVGINFAKALSLAWQIPVIPVNHMEGHITSVLKEASSAEKVSFPSIALLISGGHTELVLVKNWGEYEIIGQTKDDAIGEAYDKVARLLDLGYPGGPKISALADVARDQNLDLSEFGISLPRPMISSHDFNFSFSGIKTAVLYLVRKLQNDKSDSEQDESSQSLDEKTKSLIALEFETAVTEVLYKKTTEAIKKYDAKNLIIGGGVIANKNIRKTFQGLQNDAETNKQNEPNKQKNDQKINVLIPELDLTTDNAVMIAIAGYLKSLDQRPEINPEIEADGNLKL